MPKGLVTGNAFWMDQGSTNIDKGQTDQHCEHFGMSEIQCGTAGSSTGTRPTLLDQNIRTLAL